MISRHHLVKTHTQSKFCRALPCSALCFSKNGSSSLGSCFKFCQCYFVLWGCVISPCRPHSSKNFSYHRLCPLPLDLPLPTSSNLTVSLHLVYSLILETDSNQISLHHQLSTLSKVCSFTLVLQYLSDSPLELFHYDHVSTVLWSPKLDTADEYSCQIKMDACLLQSAGFTFTLLKPGCSWLNTTQGHTADLFSATYPQDSWLLSCKTASYLVCTQHIPRLGFFMGRTSHCGTAVQDVLLAGSLYHLML